jgi:hypothetical protein
MFDASSARLPLPTRALVAMHEGLFSASFETILVIGGNTY